MDTALSTPGSDTTDARAALAESEERYRNMVEGSIQGILVHRNFDIVFANQACAQIFGYSSPDELLALDTYLELVAPPERERLSTYLAARRAGEAAPESYEFQGLRPDGTHVWLENRVRVISWSGEPAVQSVVVDISERKRAERALELERHRLHSYLDIAGVILVALDRESKVVLINRMGLELLERPEHEVIGHDWCEVALPPRLRRRVREQLRLIARGEAALLETAEHPVVTRSGEERQIAWSNRALRDDHGQLSATLSSGTDVTERHRIEAELARHRDHLELLVEQRSRQLESAQRELVRSERLAAIGQLTATVSHELRNPLGTIRTSLHVLRHRVDMSAPGVASGVNRIERSIERCTNVIEQLLAYTQFRALQWESVEIDLWLTRLLDRIEPPAGVTLSRALGTDATVRIDPSHLHQAVMHVVANAMQAVSGESRQGEGEVRVASACAQGCVELSVSDTGPGMSPEIRAQMFEPLFSTRSFGTGLGLPLVKQIVEQHGGTVTIDSAPGEGTRVTISLRVGTARW